MKRFVQPRRVGLVLLLTTLAAVGCNQGPPLAKVSGKITCNGKPCGGQLIFTPIGGGKSSSAIVGDDGCFELKTFHDGDGALIGEHRVKVALNPIPVEMLRQVGGGETELQVTYKPVNAKIPAELIFDVQPGTNEINFDF